MVVKTTADYLKVLQQLLPPGLALTQDPASNLTKLLTAFAEVLVGVDASIAGLYDEADPRTTNQLLPDWERVCALPDPAVGGAQQSLVERRAWLMLRLTSIGGQVGRVLHRLGCAARRHHHDHQIPALGLWLRHDRA